MPLLYTVQFTSCTIFTIIYLYQGTDFFDLFCFGLARRGNTNFNKREEIKKKEEKSGERKREKRREREREKKRKDRYRPTDQQTNGEISSSTNKQTTKQKNLWWGFRFKPRMSAPVLLAQALLLLAASLLPLARGKRHRLSLLSTLLGSPPATCTYSSPDLSVE